MEGAVAKRMERVKMKMEDAINKRMKKRYRREDGERVRKEMERAIEKRINRAT